MKNNKTVIYLGTLIVIIAIGLIGVSLRQKGNNSITVSAEKVQQMIAQKQHYIRPKELSGFIHDKEIIDLRSPAEFLNGHIDGAINIPFQRILDEEYQDVLKNEKTKVLYSDSEVKAAEVWVVLAQMGVENVFVLKGGYDFWQAKVENKDIMGTVSLEDEKPKYDFKKEIERESD